ncbi:GxxExxY protein [Prevotella histicola]
MGLSEVVYKDALTYKPTKNGLKVKSEVDVSILHNNIIMTTT